MHGNWMVEPSLATHHPVAKLLDACENSSLRYGARLDRIRPTKKARRAPQVRQLAYVNWEANSPKNDQRDGQLH